MKKELPPTNLGFDEQQMLARLDAKVQEHVRFLLKLFAQVFAHPRGVVFALQEASLRYGGEKGRSFQTLRRLYYGFMEHGDWMQLIPKHLREKTRAAPLPESFVEFWRGACESNQRKCAPARRKLIARWRVGDVIPGYGTWREYWAARGLMFGADAVCPPELPEGWSKGNLYRYVSDAVQLTLARRGISAAITQLAPIIGTRVGLRPLEWVVLDDWESDFLVAVPGVERPCKLRGIICKDVATDMWLRFTLRPAALREDGKEDGIKRDDVKLVLCSLLQKFGYPTDYVMHIVLERGAATLNEGDKLALEELSGGMIKVHLTSMVSGRVLMGGFADKPVGNPRGKSWIESGFNLLHNEAGDIAGQKGRRYDLAPAELDARKKHASALLRAGKEISLRTRSLLRIPFRSLDEAYEEWSRILMAVNCSDDHNCEGFETITKWRFFDGDAWQDWDRLLEFPPETRERIQVSQRTERRIERWGRLIKGVALSRIPNEVAWRFMDAHASVLVQNYRITLRHAGTDYVFFASDSPLLVEGAKYLAYFDSRDPGCVYLTNGKGAFRGALPRVRGIRRDDLEGLREEAERRQRDLALHLAQVNQRRRDQIEQSIEDTEHNIAVLEGKIINVSATDPAASTAATPVLAGALTRALTERAASVCRGEKINDIDLRDELFLERQLLKNTDERSEQ